jgi:phosphatidate phosphatase PAH1
VDIYVNGEKTNLNMKLSSSGDAYFVQHRKRSIYNEGVSNRNKNQTDITTVEKKEEINICENEIKTKNEEVGNDSKNKLQIKIDVEESLESPRKEGISAPTTPIELSKKLQKFKIGDERKIL